MAAAWAEEGLGTDTWPGDEDAVGPPDGARLTDPRAREGDKGGRVENAWAATSFLLSRNAACASDTLCNKRQWNLLRSLF